MTERELMQEAFEELADDIGFCLDQKWGDFENPYENSDTYLAYSIFTKAWQASANRQGYKLVPVEPTEEMLEKVETEKSIFFHVSSDYCDLGTPSETASEIYKAMIGAVE